MLLLVHIKNFQLVKHRVTFIVKQSKEMQRVCVITAGVMEQEGAAIEIPPAPQQANQLLCVSSVVWKTTCPVFDIKSNGCYSWHD